MTYGYRRCHLANTEWERMASLPSGLGPRAAGTLGNLGGPALGVLGV